MPSLTDYFALLGITPSFDMDLAALERAYFEAQRQFHPDRFIGKPPQERQQALQRSVSANNAYHTLKEPHSRAVYILKTHGIDVTDSKEAVKPAQSLLLEIMQWREAIEDAASPEAVITLKNQLSGLQSEAISHISQAFRGQDWDSMAQATMRLGYILKTQADVTRKMRTMTQPKAS